MKSIRMFLVIALLSGWAHSVLADTLGHLKLQTVALQEKTTTASDGSKHTEIVPAGRVLPGVEVIYQVNYEVVGSEAVDAGAFFSDAIPKNMVYVPGSATGQGTDISFSVDGGKTWGKPETLQIKNADGTSRTALPKDYTDIRWVVKGKLAPGAKGSVSFRAVLQ